MVFSATTLELLSDGSGKTFTWEPRLVRVDKQDELLVQFRSYVVRYVYVHTTHGDIRTSELMNKGTNSVCKPGKSKDKFKLHSCQAGEHYSPHIVAVGWSLRACLAEGHLVSRGQSQTSRSWFPICFFPQWHAQWQKRLTAILWRLSFTDVQVSSLLSRIRINLESDWCWLKHKNRAERQSRFITQLKCIPTWHLPEANFAFKNSFLHIERKKNTSLIWTFTKTHIGKQIW